MLVDAFLIGLYTYFNLHSLNGQIMGLNMCVFLISLFCINFGVANFFLMGVNTFNIFILVYFISLAFNCMNLSGLQTDKGIKELYYYIPGAIIFAGFLFLAECKYQLRPVKNTTKKIVTIKQLFWMLLIAYYILNILVIKETGGRLMSGKHLSAQSSIFVIPGLSGGIAILLWTLLMISPHLEKKHIIMAFVSTVFFAGIVNMKRGDMMRIIFFYAIYYLSCQEKKLLNKNIGKILISLFFVFFAFIFLGNVRQKLRGYEGKVAISINNSLDSNIYMGDFAWLYGYTSINFDVLKLFMDEPSEYTLDSIMLPIKRVMGGNAAVENYYAQLTAEQNRGLGGFNASTLISSFIRDMGMWYFIEMCILGGILFVLIKYSKRNGYKGVYIFLLLQTSLAILGNYYSVPNYVLAMLTTIVLLKITKI